ncbi:MAG: hypothetical protein KAS32_29765 [Candidatus Peribacteraceae bacterium]|nr:hypothetical protein [Candidatus Peribacteraceae bacterium]
MFISKMLVMLVLRVVAGLVSGSLTGYEADLLLPDSMVIYEDGQWVYNEYNAPYSGCIDQAPCSGVRYDAWYWDKATKALGMWDDDLYLEGAGTDGWIPTWRVGTLWGNSIDGFTLHLIAYDGYIELGILTPLEILDRLDPDVRLYEDGSWRNVGPHDGCDHPLTGCIMGAYCDEGAEQKTLRWWDRIFNSLYNAFMADDV